MSDAEKLIEILTIVAIILVMVIVGLVLVALFMKYKKDKKPERGTNNSSKDSQKETPQYSAKSIFDFMDFEKIEDNMIIQKRGKYLMVLECQGVNYDLMSEMERTAVEQGFIQFLNTLRSEIQIYVQTRTINLEGSIATFKNKFEVIERKYEEMNDKYRDMKKS